MRRAQLLMHGIPAAVLSEMEDGSYVVEYLSGYAGEPVSLSLPIEAQRKEYPDFPAFLDGLLLEGMMFEAFLQKHKIDKDDSFSQLVRLGEDLVGAMTVVELKPNEEEGA